MGGDAPSTGLGLHEDEYDLKRQHDFFEHEASKQRRLAGEFSRAFYHDNGEAVDEFGMKLTIRQRALRAGKTQQDFSAVDAEQQSTRSQSMNPQSVTAPTRLRQTNAKYENNSNGYSTFLNEKAELPRLSILDNYKQIMRIMTNSYNKGGEYQNKFKNRMEKDIIHDEEYQKFKEEQLNTMKMSTILKSLNAPFRRSRKAGVSLSAHGANQVHG